MANQYYVPKLAIWRHIVLQTLIPVVHEIGFEGCWDWQEGYLLFHVRFDAVLVILAEERRFGWVAGAQKHWRTAHFWRRLAHALVRMIAHSADAGGF